MRVSLILAHEVLPPFFSAMCTLESLRKLHSENLGDAMTTNSTWQELYRAALLELRPDELRPRIDAAEGAIQKRLSELRQNDSNFEEEARALDDALRGLRVLVSTECQPLRSSLSVLAQSEVRS